MLLFFILAIVVAKIKGYSIKPVFKAYPLYPFFALMIFFIFLQVNIFLQNYSFVQYTSIINNVYIYTLIIPLLFYKLYKQGLFSCALIILGTLLNKFAISQNGGKMPVYPSISKFTGYFDEAAIGTADNLHIIGNASTKFKFLTDFIDIGTSIMSIGDIFIHFIIIIVIYYSLKEINIKDKGKENGINKHYSI